MQEIHHECHRHQSKAEMLCMHEIDECQATCQITIKGVNAYAARSCWTCACGRLLDASMSCSWQCTPMRWMTSKNCSCDF